MKKIFLSLIALLCSIGSAMADADPKQWMAGLNDNLYISQMSLPGAHDAATGTVSSSTNGKCQDKTIAELWDAGVRVFDLRPYDTEGCPIYHGSNNGLAALVAVNTGINLTGALTTITERLQANPKDFAIILMRNETDEGSTDNWKTRVTAIKNNFPDYVIPFNNNLRLGDVRGKVIILSRDYFADGFTIGGWGDGAQIYEVTANNDNAFRFRVQDYYNASNQTSKQTVIKSLLDEARTQTSPNFMFINHTSGYTSGIGTNGNINSNANSSNKCALEYINGNPGRTGIIMMDYAGSSSYYGAELCNAIIAQNNLLANQNLSTLSDNTDYFLQNVETGLWLQGNTAKTTTSRDGWNTAANMGSYGRPFRIQNYAADGYTLNTQSGPNALGCNYGDASLLYLDGSIGPTKWKFTGTRDAAHITINWDRWLSVDENNRLVNSNPASTWKIWTREERLAVLSSATEDDPIDVTWMMVNPELMNNDNMTPQWIISRSGGDQGWQQGFRPNRIFETWSFNSLDFFQTITVPTGKYEVQAHALYSPTGGNSCNINDYNDYVSRGDATVFAALYANDKQVKLPSIYSFTSSTPVDDYAKKSLVDGGISIVDGWWQAARAMGEDDQFMTAPLRVDVVDGQLRLGIKSIEGSPSSNWVIIGSFSLKYLGELDNVVEELQGGLSSLIQEAEAFSGNTTDILQTNLDEALANARNNSTSSNTSVLNACISALRSALDAANAVNVSVLRSTVEYAEAKGVDVSAQEDFLAYGTTNDVDDQINKVVTNLKQHMAEKSVQPTIFTMISPSVVGTDDNNRGTVVTNHADGFYAYNVGTGRWFCGGSDWGAHAAVGFPGIKITTPEDNYGSGQYNGVVTWLFNGNWNDGGKLGNNGYCDTGGNAWKFWQQNTSQGIYTWSNNGDDHGNNESNGYGTKDLVGFSPSTYMRVDVHQEGADNPYNQWIFVTEAQRDAMAAAAMATASESNPVDLTYKIKMPGFNQRERKEGENQSSDVLDWTCNHANYRYGNGRLLIMGRGDNHADFVCDVYGYEWNDEFSMTQTITGLTPGRYRVKVQGYNNNGDAANKAYLEANGQKTTLVERSSESVLPWTSKLPENTFDNPEYFQAGCYWNEVICTVGSNGELTLGVESPSITGSHVVVFDNFRLAYLGVPDITIAETDTQAPSALNVPANVTLTRTLKGGQWNGFSVPFGFTVSGSALEGAEVKQFKSVAGNEITLETASAVVAGEPYLVKPTNDIENPTFNGVMVSNPSEAVKGTGDYTFQAHLYNTALPTDGSVAYVSTSDSSIKKLTSGSIKGLRSIFNIPVVSGAKALIIQFEDSADGILSVDAEGNIIEGEIYNVAGQRISAPQKGVNIINGKKVLVK